MVRNREEAAKLAESLKVAAPGICQLWTRNVFDSASVGDVDGDGDADAVDGWKSEPKSAQHTDRRPPRGVPVAFSGGSRGFGHRAVSLGNGKIRSTDMSSTGYSAGNIGTTTIGQIEKSMGVKYLGWSETIGGVAIPLKPKKAPVKPKPAPPVKKSRGVKIDEALRLLKTSTTKDPFRAKQKKLAIEALLKMPFIK